VKRYVVAISVAIALAIGIAAALRMRHAETPPALAGEWKSWRSQFRITRHGDAYRIAISNPNGFLGGEYIGKLDRDALDVSGPLAALCPRMQYVRDGDKLQFCGEEFDRVRTSSAASRTSGK
jgi:hypothetical protein